MTRCVRRWSVGRSVIISYKGGKLHFHAPIGALLIVIIINIIIISSSINNNYIDNNNE